MNSHYLIEVMDMLHIKPNSKINYHKKGDATYTYQYIYENQEEAYIQCISHTQGYPCDYIIVGLLLSEDVDVVVEDKLNYKKAYRELVDCIESRYLNCNENDTRLYSSLLEYIQVIEVRNQGE